MEKFKKNLDKFFKSKWATICFLIIAVGITCLLFGRLIFTRGFISVGDHQDYEYHINVMLALDELFHNGNIFSKILPNILSDLGYGTNMFYGTLPHILTVLLKNLLGVSMINAIKVMIVCSFYTSGIIMYFFLNRVFKSRKMAMFGAVIFMCTPYYLTDIYTRFAYSEYFLFVFMIIAFWAVYEFVQGNLKCFYPLFIVGFSCCFLTHLSLSVWIVLFSFVYLVFNYKKVFEHRKWIHFLLASGVVILLTLYFTLPMLESMLVGYRVNDNELMGTRGDLILRTAQWCITGLPDESKHRYLIPLFNFIVDIIVIISAIMYAKKSESEQKDQIILMVAIVLVCMLFMSSFAVFWIVQIPLIAMIQLPWRINMFIGFFVALLSPSVLKLDFKMTWKKVVLVVSCICLVFCWSPFTQMKTSFSETYSDEELRIYESTYMGSGYQQEYIPNTDVQEMWNAYTEKIVEQCSIGLYGTAIDENSITIEIKREFVTEMTVDIDTYLPFDENLDIKLFTRTTNHDVIENNIKLEQSTIECIQKNGRLSFTITIPTADSVRQKIVIDYSNSEVVKEYLNETPVYVDVVSGTLKVDNFTKDTPSMSFDITECDSAVVSLPLVYYKGYKITLDNDEGSKELDYTMSDDGYIQIRLDELGTIRVEYKGTIIVKLSSFVSRVTLLLVVTGGVAYEIYEVIRKKNYNAY